MNHVPSSLSPAPSASVTHGRRRIGDIEMLRGLAITMVVIEHLHWNLINWPSHFIKFTMHFCGLWTGVDLFLVISGFVIGRNLLPMISLASTGESGRLDLVAATLAFWVRRAWRLLPSAWLWLAVPFAASFWFNRTGLFGPPSANFADMVAAMLNVANLHMGEHFPPLVHTTMYPYWSLSLEEQFYLLLPILVVALHRRLAWLLAVAVVAQFFMPWAPMANFTRFGALAAGVLLAIWSGTPSYRICEPTGLAHSHLVRLAFVVGGIVLIAALGAEDLAIVSFRFGLIAVVAGGLVWAASYDRNYLASDGMLKNALIWLGSRSYGIYLIHAPVFVATREIWFRISPAGTVFDGTYAWRFVLTAAVLILGLSELNHRFVEQPLRRRGVAIARRIENRKLAA
jgi:peptidoglycan/LPS O-acetylase OafA/YrhL